MSDESPEALRRRIAELEASLLQPMPDIVRQVVEQQIAALRAALDAALAALGQPASPAIDLGTANQMGDPTAQGAGAGGALAKTTEVAQPVTVTGGYVGQIIAHAVLGPDPEAEALRRLGAYLSRLAAGLDRLVLQALDPRQDRGDGLALHQVYTLLATTARDPLPALDRTAFQGDDLARPLKREHDPDWALPDAARFVETGAERGEPRLSRPRLAVAAIAAHPRLALLGDPGSGKSTLLRHLAWSLARRHTQPTEPPALLGWPADLALMPVILPLRTLAGRVAAAGPAPTTVLAALRDAMAETCVQRADDILDAALERGSALLLLDGLDEVPIEATLQAADRATTLDALRAFLDIHPAARAVLTCRTRAFDPDLQRRLGWPAETLAPFTLGQVRHFAHAWFAGLAAAGQLAPEQAERMRERLVASVTAAPRLRQMAEAPLLLTLMALVLAHEGELPRDRPRLYQRIMLLLLGQWEKVGKQGQSFFEAVGLPGWESERLLPLLDRLSFDAHRAASSADGRGRLARGDLYAELLAFLAQARAPQPGEAARLALQYIEQRSGLLAADGPRSYVFAHLTLQEYCAGRHLALNETPEPGETQPPDPVQAMLALRHDDRWREPIMLGAGLLRPRELHALLEELIEPGEKEPARRQRDLILAAEVGKDRDWDQLRTTAVKVDRLQADLRAGLAALLGDTSQPLPVAERVQAGFRLGELGDPRFPVDVAQWRDELAQRNEQFGAPAGYLCYVPGGQYRIGGWAEGEDAADVALQPFWVARFPITVAQYAPFVAEGYGPGAERWWTPEGWGWKEQEPVTRQPIYWGRSGYDRANQPVVTITWHEATAYCAWLTERLAGALPPGYVVRLPTEAEWEVAAAYDGAGQRCPYPWGEAEPTSELAITRESGVGRPAPVGSCPAGAAACGALDLAGNVGELAAGEYRDYPGGSHAPMKDLTNGQTAWRGGSWYQNRSSVRCGARDRYRVRVVLYEIGFRCVVAPPL